MAELKPCPFCGCEDIEVKQCFSEYYAYCNNCELETGCFTSLYELIEYWNRRVDNEDHSVES